MKVIYLAGPIRAGGSVWLREQNIRKAEELALQLWRMGFAVICPHTMNRFYDDIGDEVQVFLDGDMELIKRCNAVLFMDGWEDSEGSQQEHSFSLKEGMLIFYGLSDLRSFLTEHPHWK